MTYDSITDWLLRNRRTGKITLAQAPNLPAWISFLSIVAAWLFPDSKRAKTFASIAAVAATWWGAGELASGVNPLRRIQGAGVLSLLASALLRK